MRIGWDEYFLKMCLLVAERSTCKRRKVGSLAVKGNKVLATGYNGAPSGVSHCTDVGCLREELAVPSGERHELCRGVHAEQNVVAQGALHGVSLEGSILYLTIGPPCGICAKILINTGIKEIRVGSLVYPDKLAEEILEEAELNVKCI